MTPGRLEEALLVDSTPEFNHTSPDTGLALLPLALYPEDCRRPVFLPTASPTFAEAPLAGLSTSGGHLAFWLVAFCFVALYFAAFCLRLSGG
jgi:hypothetical protein